MRQVINSIWYNIYSSFLATYRLTLRRIMTQQRVAKLLQLAAQSNLDAVAIMPGPNMQYFSGLHFHLSERPTLAIIPVEGQPALICPAFEATKTQRSSSAWQLFTYVDGQDPLEAFHT